MCACCHPAKCTRALNETQISLTDFIISRSTTGLVTLLPLWWLTNHPSEPMNKYYGVTRIISSEFSLIASRNRLNEVYCPMPNCTHVNMCFGSLNCWALCKNTFIHECYKLKSGHDLLSHLDNALFVQCITIYISLAIFIMSS